MGSRPVGPWIAHVGPRRVRKDKWAKKAANEKGPHVWGFVDETGGNHVYLSIKRFPRSAFRERASLPLVLNYLTIAG